MHRMQTCILCVLCMNACVDNVQNIAACLRSCMHACILFEFCKLCMHTCMHACMQASMHSSMHITHIMHAQIHVCMHIMRAYFLCMHPHFACVICIQACIFYMRIKHSCAHVMTRRSCVPAPRAVAVRCGRRDEGMGLGIGVAVSRIWGEGLRLRV